MMQDNVHNIMATLILWIYAQAPKGYLLVITLPFLHKFTMTKIKPIGWFEFTLDQLAYTTHDSTHYGCPFQIGSIFLPLFFYATHFYIM